MSYKDDEEKFLEAIADEVGFIAPKDRFLFVYRHLDDNADMTHEAFVRLYADRLQQWFRRQKNDQPETEDQLVFRLTQAVRDRLSRNIWKKLGKKGLDEVREWLKTEKYPQWLQPQLWENLWLHSVFD